MDELDEQILVALEADARLSMRELARRVHLSAPSVAERVRRLEERGIITGYAARVQRPSDARSIEAFVDVMMREPAHQKFQAFVAAHDAVRAAHRVAGAGCYILRIVVLDRTLLDDLIAELSAFANYRLSIVLSSTVRP